MDVESVVLKVTLKEGGNIHMKGTKFTQPFPPFIREEIRAEAPTLELFYKGGAPAPSPGLTDQQKRLADLQESQKLVQVELANLQQTSSEKEDLLLKEIEDLEISLKSALEDGAGRDLRCEELDAENTRLVEQIEFLTNELNSRLQDTAKEEKSRKPSTRKPRRKAS